MRVLHGVSASSLHCFQDVNHCVNNTLSVIQWCSWDSLPGLSKYVLRWFSCYSACFIFFPSTFRKCDLCVFVPLIVLSSVTESSHSSCDRNKKEKYCFMQCHAILAGCGLLFQASVLMRDANPKQIGPSHQSKAKPWVGFLGPLPWKFHCLSRLPVTRFPKQILKRKESLKVSP